MANEIQVRASLRVAKGNVKYQNPVTSFRADMAGAAGPKPGGVTVRTTGTVIDLSGLTNPLWCQVTNQSSTNFFTLGVYDGAAFYPLLEFQPGWSLPVPLSRYVNEEFVGTGTGTGSDVNQLMAVADTADVEATFEAFSA